MWWEKYIGKPWENIPDPPKTFNCGELIRYIYQTHFYLDIPPIQADGSKIRECLANLCQPEAYGLHPFEGPSRPFDVVYLMRRVRRDHIALHIRTPQGPRFLHCVQGAGVVCESEFEMKATTGSNFMEWRRHQDITEEMTKCLV